jgi:pilus assembly protein Flp/PilA
LKKLGYLLWKLQWPVRGENGQGMVEYALLLVLISVVVIVVLLTMGNQIKNVFSDVVCSLGTGCTPPEH